MNTLLWLRWIAVNGVFLAVLIAGFMYDIEWAAITYTVMTILAVLVFIGLYAIRNGLKIMTNKPRPVPLWLDRLYDLSSFGVLVWSGHLILAVAYIVSMFGIVNIMQSCTYELKEGEEANV